MADEKNFNFNVDGPIDPEKPIKIELIQRTGTAKKIFERRTFSLLVLIGSIYEWVSKRTHPTPVQENPGVIVYSRNVDAPFIKYLQDPNDELATTLTAKMEVNPDLDAFGINRGVRFTQKELENHVRTYAHCFESLEVAKDLIKRMQNFDVRYEQQVKKTDDRRGETEDLVKSALKFAKGELPATLTLRLPLYVGTDAQDVEVEIEVDRGRANMPEFSFYSIDLEVRKQNIVKTTIEGEVEKFREGFPVLEVDGE